MRVSGCCGCVCLCAHACVSAPLACLCCGLNSTVCYQPLPSLYARGGVQLLARSSFSFSIALLEVDCLDISSFVLYYCQKFMHLLISIFQTVLLWSQGFYITCFSWIHALRKQCNLNRQCVNADVGNTGSTLTLSPLPFAHSAF